MKLLAEHKMAIRAIQRLAYDQHTIGKIRSGGPCACGRPSGSDHPTPACEGLKVLLDAYSKALAEEMLP